MKKIVLIIVFVISSSVMSATITDLKQLIKKHHFKESELGLLIQEADHEVFALNPDKMMVPASLTKIVTAGAVLNTFLLNKKFSTELYYSAPSGNLCLKGGGDPSFVSEKMWFLVNELKRTEINSVAGDIVVDSGRFDDEFFDIGRESVRVDRAFDAPISASSFNWNSVNVFVRPGSKKGEAARIFLDPENDYLELENKAHTGSKGSSKTLEVSRKKDGDHDKITISGSIPEGAEETVVYKSISNPNLWIGAHLKQFLKQRSIEVKGKVRVGKCEASAIKVASVQSKNLNEILSDMLKFSNNFVAEMLAKNLAAEKNISLSTPATMKSGIEEIKKYLDGLEFKRSDYVLENVSGLTRDNRFSAKQLAKVLTSIRNDFLTFPEFLSGLPIAGQDGTLKNRMKNSKGESVVRAKTGYLDGVVGLAGYVGRKNKPPLVFVFMFNGTYEQGTAARPLFDDLINHLKSL
jgi:D-alanyl-D-alanine carboxypeptidase/D-alanyl-D-alanine-endopeptidase (penicillin-binding protein 4)